MFNQLITVLIAQHKIANSQHRFIFHCDGYAFYSGVLTIRTCCINCMTKRLLWCKNSFQIEKHKWSGYFGKKWPYPRSPCQSNSFTRLLIRAFSQIEKPSLFSNLAALTAKSENKTKALECQGRLRLPGCLVDMKLTYTIIALQSVYHCRVNKCLPGCRVNCPLSTQMPGEQVLIYPAAG